MPEGEIDASQRACYVSSRNVSTTESSKALDCYTVFDVFCHPIEIHVAGFGRIEKYTEFKPKSQAIPKRLHSTSPKFSC